MNALPLFLANGTPVLPHLCGKCNRVWESQYGAERCCVCLYCGEYCDWNGSVSHPECADRRHAEIAAERLDKAELVTNYTGPFLVNNRFYSSVDDLLGCIDQSEIPEFGFCLHEQAAYIDIGDVIEAVAEQMHEDWSQEPCEELERGIEAWNKANEGNSSYFECDDRKWSKAAILAALAQEQGSVTEATA